MSPMVDDTDGRCYDVDPRVTDTCHLRYISQHRLAIIGILRKLEEAVRTLVPALTTTRDLLFALPLSA
jgi:hypothetical protein